MNREEYTEIERYMLERMRDSAHDCMHIYRVLYAALEIARTERAVDHDILIAACLLHDIGRAEQLRDSSLDHAAVGGKMALEFLTGIGWEKERALWVKECVETHRYRRDRAPGSIEAKILFDADKLDAAGAMGIARTLFYEGETGEPLYVLDGEGRIVTEGVNEEFSSFFQEFNFKLRGLYERFHTKRGGELAAKRRKAAADFYDSLLSEAEEVHAIGTCALYRVLTE